MKNVYAEYLKTIDLAIAAVKRTLNIVEEK